MYFQPQCKLFIIQDISFFVQSQQFKIRKDLFLELSRLKQQKKNFRRTNMPQWVTIKVFMKIEQYINTKDLSSVDITSIQQIQKLLWIGDLFFLENLQQRLITQIIIPNLKEQNSLAFLVQSHKKLKNSQSSPQCWYSLLNNCMTFIATNIVEMYRKYQKEIKKLNEKILNQILERSIKNIKKHHYARKHQMFKIIMECKEVAEVSILCRFLREGIIKRKINPQIHANLAWKLVNLKQIQLKKTKVFKFIDYEWRLCAMAIADNDHKKLKISLTLQSKTTLAESNFTNGTNTDEFQIQTQSAVSYSQTQSSGFSKIATFQKVGIFYLKLITKIGDQVYQSPIRIHYLNIEDQEAIELLDFNEIQLEQIGSKKVQLTLFCSIEPVYTFILNYLIQNIQFSKLTKSVFSVDEYLLIYKIYNKQNRNYESFKVISQLAQKHRKFQEAVLRSMINNVNLAEVPREQIFEFCQFLRQNNYHKLREQINVQLSLISQKSRLEIPNQKAQEKSIYAGSESKQLEISRLNDSRGVSRGSRSRLKKIFQSPRKHNPLIEEKANQKKRLDFQLDIRRYIFQKESPFYRAFNDLIF